MAKVELSLCQFVLAGNDLSSPFPQLNSITCQRWFNLMKKLGGGGGGYKFLVTMGIKHHQYPQNELFWGADERQFAVCVHFHTCTNSYFFLIEFLFFLFFFKSVCLMLELCNYGQIMGEADGIRKPLMGLSTQLPS